MPRFCSGRVNTESGWGALRVNIRYLKLSLAMGLALGSTQVMALGLGQLQVKSGLNQPLVAEIPIFSAMPGELDSLNVRLASPEAFERVGLDRPGNLTANLSFSVGKNARGQNVILITSSGKFAEPFLSFLIEADWGRGSVTKEYTALIDPPYIAKAIVQPMQAPTVSVAPVQTAPPAEFTLPPIVLKPEPEPAPVAVATPTPTPEAAPPPSSGATVIAEAPPAAPATALVEPEPAVAQAAPEPTAPEAELPAPFAASEPVAIPIPAPTPAPAEPIPVENSAEYGPVSKGKTLSEIAQEVRPDASVSIKQMMVALLRANPEAFNDDNINKLKRGSVLRIPARDESTVLSDEQAATMVAEQSASWRAQRQPVPQPSETVADNTPAAEPATADVLEAPLPAVVKAKPKPTVAVNKPKARLEIVPPSGKASMAKAAQSGAAAAGGTELRAELTQAREDIAVRDAEITDLKSRVSDMESQQTDIQKLIALKDSQLKALQDELGKTPPVVTAAPTTAAQANSPAEAKAKVIPAPEPWYLNPLVSYGAGAFLLLGGLVWFLRRSKNKSEDDEPVVSRRISDDADLQASLSSLQDAKSAHTDQPFTGGKVPKAGGNTQVIPATAAKPNPAPIISPTEPDLVTLRKAVRSKPQDIEAQLALLRYYYTRGEIKDFEATAQTMRTHISSAQDPRWREAVVMGVALLPGHPLFNQAGWNSPKYGAPTKAVQTSASELLHNDEENVFSPQQDFDELDVFEAVSIVNPNEQAEIPVFAETDGMTLMSESDFVAHDNIPDIHRSESELMDVDTASSTKIELARAYLEIGDIEGARSMLEEVTASGSAPAKAMAQRIIEEIG
jgi:pilus assembly protein FimV